MNDHYPHPHSRHVSIPPPQPRHHYSPVVLLGPTPLAETVTTLGDVNLLCRWIHDLQRVVVELQADVVAKERAMAAMMCRFEAEEERRQQQQQQQQQQQHNYNHHPYGGDDDWRTMYPTNAHYTTYTCQPQPLYCDSSYSCSSWATSGGDDTATAAADGGTSYNNDNHDYGVGGGIDNDAEEAHVRGNETSYPYEQNHEPPEEDASVVVVAPLPATFPQRQQPEAPASDVVVDARAAAPTLVVNGDDELSRRPTTTIEAEETTTETSSNTSPLPPPQDVTVPPPSSSATSQRRNGGGRRRRHRLTRQQRRLLSGMTAAAAAGTDDEPQGKEKDDGDNDNDDDEEEEEVESVRRRRRELDIVSRALTWIRLDLDHAITLYRHGGVPLPPSLASFWLRWFSTVPPSSDKPSDKHDAMWTWQTRAAASSLDAIRATAAALGTLDEAVPFLDTARATVAALVPLADLVREFNFRTFSSPHYLIPPSSDATRAWRTMRRLSAAASSP